MKRQALVVGVLVLGLVGAMLLSGCSSSADAGSSTVEMTSAHLFAPQAITVSPGEVVAWLNVDTDPHAPVTDPLNAAANGPSSDSQFPQGVLSGMLYYWRVPQDAASGTQWFYHCRLDGAAGDGSHLGTGMVGLITVK